jgi:hypothetical protein
VYLALPRKSDTSDHLVANELARGTINIPYWDRTDM